MRLGRFEINVVSDGTFKLDGGAMFGVVPKVLWNRLHPADEDNRIELSLDCLLVRFDDRFVILECGIGDKFPGREEKIYQIDRKGGMLARLKEMGITPEMITDVIPSHLHFDHCGFLTKAVEPGRYVPTFPKAICHFQKEHVRWAQEASRKDRASFRKEDFEPVLKSNLACIHDGEFKLSDDFEFFVSNGHTPNQQHARLKDGHHNFIFCGDLVPTSAHIKLAYNMAYDNRPIENIDEKSKLLKEAAKDGALLYFYHDPKVKLISIKESKKDFEVSEVFEIS